MADEKIELTEEQKAYERLQAQMQHVLADELTALVQRYVGIYGVQWRTVVWALHAAQIRALTKLEPQVQLAQWTVLVDVMEKRLAALEGKPPEAPAEQPAQEESADAE